MRPEGASLERLRFLVRIVRKQIKLLHRSDQTLFSSIQKPWSLAELESDDLLANAVETFVARFGRLQDILGDKLLPRLLKALGENPSSFADNLDLAEKLGWMESVSDWLGVRELRNQMIHEYLEDLHILKIALEKAHAFVSKLIQVANNLIQEINRRGWLVTE